MITLLFHDNFIIPVILFFLFLIRLFIHCFYYSFITIKVSFLFAPLIILLILIYDFKILNHFHFIINFYYCFFQYFIKLEFIFIEKLLSKIILI